ncbi:activated RNA polymerase II transcriptional coactivator p15-like [Hemicordylus capensis]|uniref:activated RNA polymerase II transcriptional coactivator p15-like n=1 Tax=Hemicordylus capensis TaxID=884348 RepID=UPI002304A6A2|nr:activated RNA polymerase II transcriptional coactivator p15-like [Hemicordylus capensis]XP_053154266.1 activated RNA polymerase II transcriptional coactivator p15-like [Hemicordylus capensis]XP_053154267.1 activated RNA polymerase II transcriptional coactivator p15-like [Hemicordylus capensis]XP_053154269.1 activated RNA polymerase II transcriptional coactivator p15-like [Hemicordylus capensis]
MPKSKDLVETISSDSSSDAEIENNQKKKKAMPSKPQKRARTESMSAPRPPAKSSKQDDTQEDMFQIGKLRYVCVSLFKGKVLVDLREFYMDKAGDMKPGRKGISLAVDQWQSLKAIIPDIDAAIKKF